MRFGFSRCRGVFGDIASVWDFGAMAREILSVWGEGPPGAVPGGPSLCFRERVAIANIGSVIGARSSVCARTPDATDWASAVCSLYRLEAAVKVSPEGREVTGLRPGARYRFGH